MSTTKKAKELLSEYQTADQRLHDIMEERVKLYSLLEVGSIGFESDGSSKGSSDVDKRTHIHVRLADIDMDLEREKINCMEKLHETMVLIRKIPCNTESGRNQNMVLKMRYINGFTWELIAVKMGYSVRQVHYIHGKALQTVSKFI